VNVGFLFGASETLVLPEYRVTLVGAFCTNYPTTVRNIREERRHNGLSFGSPIWEWISRPWLVTKRLEVENGSNMCKVFARIVTKQICGKRRMCKSRTRSLPTGKHVPPKRCRNRLYIRP